MEQLAKGTRFPRSMLNGPANERLLRSLGVESVDELDLELEDYARAWLLTVPRKGGTSETRRAASRVREALERVDGRRAA
jgi:hypothetical protein